MKKFFKVKDVKKFFAILDRLDRTSQDHYLGWDKLNPTLKPCQQQVFIERTVAKWFYGRRFKIVEEAGTGFYKTTDSGWESKEIKMKRFAYISLARPRFNYGYSNAVKVNYSDASKPNQMHTLDVTYNFALSLQAEEISEEEFKKVKSMFTYYVDGFVEVDKVRELLEKSLLHAATTKIEDLKIYDYVDKVMKKYDRED